MCIPDFILPTRCCGKQVELKNKDDWVKINAGQHTLMRVLYTPEMMKRLERGVRDRTLTPEVRVAQENSISALGFG